jgi:hypothetical protein
MSGARVFPLNVAAAGKRPAFVATLIAGSPGGNTAGYSRGAYGSLTPNVYRGTNVNRMITSQTVGERFVFELGALLPNTNATFESITLDGSFGGTPKTIVLLRSAAVFSQVVSTSIWEWAAPTDLMASASIYQMTVE